MDGKCPVCGCQKFYVKDPDDEYETTEFHVEGGEIVFEPGASETPADAVADDAEAFCDKCAWHGDLCGLKKR